MALVQAGAAGSKILLLIGAGVTGSYIINHSQLSDLLSDLSKVLSKHLNDGNKNEGNGGENDGATAALSAQVRRLTQELRQLATLQGRPIVVNSSDRGGGIYSMVLPVATLGALGYGYMWWKGLSLGDLMYVTKRGMSSMVESVTKQMEGLTAALAATKRQLSGRLDGVSKTVNETAVLTGLVKQELTAAKSDLGRVGMNVGMLQGDMVDVKDCLSTLESKQDFANQGIVLLCRFVVDGLGTQKPELVQGLHAYSRGGTIPRISNGSKSGLKLLQELEGLVEKIETVSPVPSASSLNGVSEDVRGLGIQGLLSPAVLTRSSSTR